MAAVFQRAWARPWRAWRRGVLQVIAVGLLLVFAWPTVQALVQVYSSLPYYSHGFLIPLVTLYALWRRRAGAATLPSSSSWPGLILLAAGVAGTVLVRWYEVALYAAGLGSVFLAGCGLILIMAGLVRAWSSRGALRVLMPPLAFLLFALPLPESVVVHLTLPLRHVSTSLARWLLWGGGVPVVQEGNVLQLAQGAIGIGEACSGIISVWVLMAGTAGFALCTGARRFRAALLTAAVVPVVIAANTVRVIVSSLSLVTGHAELTRGQAHEILGLCTFGLSVIVLFFLAEALCRRPAPPASTAPAEVPPSRPVMAAWRQTVTRSLACLLLAGGLAGAHTIERHYADQDRARSLLPVARTALAQFPAQVGGFQRVEVLDLSAEELRTLQPADRLVAVYQAPTGERLRLVLLYWHPQQVSRRAQWLGPHRIDVCYPGQGWLTLPEDRDDREYEWLPGQTVLVRLARRAGEAGVAVAWDQLSWFRPFAPKEYLSKLRDLLRSWSPTVLTLPKQHSVRIWIMVTGSAEQARRVALEFSKAIAPLLPDYGLGTQEPTPGPTP